MEHGTRAGRCELLVDPTDRARWPSQVPKLHLPSGVQGNAVERRIVAGGAHEQNTPAREL